MTVAAILLAAGAGSRFTGASHKLTADLRGDPVVVHALRSAVGAGFNQIVVVAGAVELDSVLDPMLSQSEGRVQIVHNPDWKSGQASSMQVGIDAIRSGGHSAVVVGLGDQPDVGIAAWRVVGASHGRIVAATFGGRRRPPVKLDSSVWDLLPTEGDDGARVLMNENPGLVSEVPCAGDPSDIDTADDLLAAARSVVNSP